MDVSKKVFLLTIFCVLNLVCLAQKLVVYPGLPSQFGKQSDEYKVILQQGDVTKEAYVYKSKSGDGPQSIYYDQQNKFFNYLTFSFNGSVKVTVVKLSSSAISAVIRPTRLLIKNSAVRVANGGKATTFILNKPGKLSVEFSDDPLNKNPLVIFADSLENNWDVPSKDDSKVFIVNNNIPSNFPSGINTVVFPAGYYQIGYWIIPQNITQVYIAGGAFIDGYFYTRRSYNQAPIKINGRGILSNEAYSYHYPGIAGSKVSYKMIQIDGGTNNVIEGITMVGATSFNIAVYGNNIVITNLNINSFKLGNDAISIGGDNNIIENCFIRDNDDDIVLYGNSTKVKDCTFWQLSDGSIIQLGWQPHNIMGNNIVNNCDVIHAEWKDTSNTNIGFITARIGADNKDNKPIIVENFTISNIYFDTNIIRFLDIRQYKKLTPLTRINADANSWTFKNFTFNNINFKLDNDNDKPLIYLNKFDNNKNITGFNFKNISINGRNINHIETNKRFNIKNVPDIQFN